MRLIYITAIVMSGALTLTMVFSAATQKTYPGFRQWILGTGLVAVGYLGLGLRGIIPDWLAILLVSLAFPLAMVHYYGGTRRFFALAPMSRGWYGVPVGAAVASGVLYFVHDDIGLRSFLFGIAFALPHLATARLVAVHRRKDRLVFYTVVAAEMTVAAALVFARGVWALVTPGYSVLADSPVLITSSITLIALQCIVAIAFIVLNHERLQKDLAETESALAVRLRDLQNAMLEVKTLKGLLPICASCKKIRDSQGDWTEFEVYVRERTEARFSHGVCPDCAGRLYPDLV